MSVSSPARVEVAYLADQIERSFRGGAWHGPAVAEALFGVDAASAVRRPLAAGHTLWEIVRHLRAWIDITRYRIDGEAAGTVSPEDDWPPAGTTDAEWAEELAALEESHRRLKATLKALGDERLTDPVAGSDPTVRGLLFGLLQHNAYHAGQVILLKKALAAEVGAG